MFSSTETTTAEVSLDNIRIDGGTQPRAALDYGYISELAQDMLLTNTSLKPAIVYYDGSEYWLADGFHRYHAAKQICRETIEAEVRQGTRRDAVLYSVGANATHGLRRTNADKRRSVETLLLDPEWAKWSDREIARRCGVDNAFVSKLRKESSVDGQQIEARYVDRNGTIYTMNTANIGQSPSESRLQEQLTQAEIHTLEPQSGPFYGLTYQSPVPVSTPPTSEQLDTRVQSLDRWQQDNVTLGLDRWGDPLSDNEEDIDDEEMNDTPVEDVAPPVAETEEKPEERSHFMQIMTSSETPEWYTPEHIIARVIELFGEIDLDPCSNSQEQPNVPARHHYTKEDDGLAQEWAAKSVYMNPPYGSEIAKWTAKLVESHRQGKIEEAIALLPGRIDTAWFQPLYDYLICNVRGRLQFSGAEYSAPFPSVAVYLGDRKDEFKRTFATLGPIVERVA